VLFRTALAKKVGAFDGSIGYIIDLDYWVRLLKHGNAYYLTQPVSTFRVSPGSWSVAIGSQQNAEFTRFINKLVEQHTWGITPLDAKCGRFTAWLNKLMRVVFYKVVLQNN